MRLDKSRTCLGHRGDVASMWDTDATCYRVSAKYLGQLRAEVFMVTDETPRAVVAYMIRDARKRMRVCFGRLDRKRQEAAKR